MMVVKPLVQQNVPVTQTLIRTTQMSIEENIEKSEKPEMPCKAPPVSVAEPVKEKSQEESPVKTEEFSKPELSVVLIDDNYGENERLEVEASLPVDSAQNHAINSRIESDNQATDAHKLRAFLAEESSGF